MTARAIKKSYGRLGAAAAGACLLWLSGCTPSPTQSAASPTAAIPQFPPLAVTPNQAPVQIEYHPFKAIKYRHVLGGVNDKHPMISDLVVTGESAGNNLKISITILRFVIDGKEGIGDPNKVITIIISRNGEFKQVFDTTPQGSIPSPFPLEQFAVTFAPVFPIYANKPVANGQMLARTSSMTDDLGRRHRTMVVRGYVNYRGIKALWLDFDQQVFEQKAKSDLPDWLPTRGHVIIDPSNGTVLRSQWIGADGSVESLDLL